MLKNIAVSLTLLAVLAVCASFGVWPGQSGWIDLSGILPAGERINSESVLNGIAYDIKGDRLFVTGKQWPKVFEIKVVPPVSHAERH